MTATRVHYDVREGVARLTLEGPDRLNALGSATCEQLREHLSRAGADDNVRVVVLTGTGRAFCAGVDLKEMAEIDSREEEFRSPVGPPGNSVFEALLHTYKPTVAALNGIALGAGCELALACDARIAVDTAEIGLPEATRGLGAAFGSVILPRLVPRAVAFEMLYLGRRVSASEALRWGLITAVHRHADFSSEVVEYVRAIAANAPLTLQRYKHTVVKTVDLPVLSALRLDVGPDPYASSDRREGVRAFLERRPPVFMGR